MIKKKLKYNDLIKLIVQIGYERYNSLNKELANIYKYDESYFYLIFQIINLFIFQRMLNFKNSYYNSQDFFQDASALIIDSIQSEYKDDLLLGYIQISNEIQEIWKNDRDDNSNNEVYRTANYLVNEMLECDENENKELKNFFTQYICDCHFENKNIIKNVKIQI